MNFSAGVLPSAHSHEGICSSATTSSLKGYWYESTAKLKLCVNKIGGLELCSQPSEKETLCMGGWGVNVFDLPLPKLHFNLWLASVPIALGSRQGRNTAKCFCAAQRRRCPCPCSIHHRVRAQLNGKIVRLSFSPLVDCALASSAKPGQCSCVHRYCNPF